VVFFNDPIPCDEPAWRAVQLAVAMRTRASALGIGWARKGHPLAMGIGIAIGYATCGQIGFEGRYEYTAIGTVTNLASRLCGVAAGGQILVSPRVFSMVDGRATAESLGPMEFKGLRQPMETFNITGLA